MRILIAEDDLVSRRVLEATLVRWGYEVVVAVDGEVAWQVLEREDTPRLAVLDRMMPGADGVELCRRVRALGRAEPTYLILLTGCDSTDDVVTGLEAGADDYVIKPFAHPELRARVRVGERVVALRASLAQRVRELEAALAQVKQLQGMLPICCYCKKIRDDGNYWQQVEHYIASHSGARFSHGICPECFDSVVKQDLKNHFGRDVTE